MEKHIEQDKLVGLLNAWPWLMPHGQNLRGDSKFAKAIEAKA